MRAMIEFVRSRLRRETSDGAFIAPVDGLRFFAIGSVILYHLQDYVVAKTDRVLPDAVLHRVLAEGHLGVPLFFVISGFIIARPFLNGTFPGAGRYFQRRLTRLEPPYALNLLLVWILLVVVRGDDGVALLPHLLASLFYVHGLVYDSMSEINFVAWSLEVEFQFYVLAPLVLLPLAERPVLRRCLLVALLVAGCFSFARQPAPIGIALVNNVGFFAAGILVCEVFVARWREQLPDAGAFDLLLFGGALLLVVGRSLAPAGVDPAPIAFGAIVLGGLGGRWAARALSWTPLYVIGGMCYTLYLYHFLVISAVGRFVLPWLDPDGPLLTDLLVAALLIVPVVIAIGAFMFLAVERPFMVLGRRRRETVAAAAAPGDVHPG